MHGILKWPLFLATICIQAGCAGNIPGPIRDAPADSPDIATVRNRINAHIGAGVRWGGSIVTVENRADSTWIEVVASKLNHYGMPSAADEDAGGRFIAQIEGFLDPEVYRKQRRITVFGTVEGREERSIDEHPYHYPLVSVSSYYLWPVRYYSPRQTLYRYPSYYSPFWRHSWHRLHYPYPFYRHDYMPYWRYPYW